MHVHRLCHQALSPPAPGVGAAAWDAAAVVDMCDVCALT
jgi:hypothetical protein